MGRTPSSSRRRAWRWFTQTRRSTCSRVFGPDRDNSGSGLRARSSFQEAPTAVARSMLPVFAITPLLRPTQPAITPQQRDRHETGCQRVNAVNRFGGARVASSRLAESARATLARERRSADRRRPLPERSLSDQASTNALVVCRTLATTGARTWQGCHWIHRVCVVPSRVGTGHRNRGA